MGIVPYKEILSAITIALTFGNYGDSLLNTLGLLKLVAEGVFLRDSGFVQLTVILELTAILRSRPVGALWCCSSSP
ncbi:MAG: hypothetical protein RI993_950 [Pseudomonadota bacterium]|jgi:hypothetical protein